MWERDLVAPDPQWARPPPPEASRSTTLIPNDYWEPSGAGSWEHAEKHAEKAIRSGAVFLNDFAIARRLPERELRRKGWAELRAAWTAYFDGKGPRPSGDPWQRFIPPEVKAREAAEKAERQRMEAEARAETERQWQARQAERDRRQAERQADWERGTPMPLIEVGRILGSRWTCIACQSIRTLVTQKGADRYQILCLHCGKVAEGDHKQLMELINRDPG